MRIILILLAVIVITGGAAIALRESHANISKVLLGLSSMLFILLVVAFFNII